MTEVPRDNANRNGGPASKRTDKGGSGFETRVAHD